jgi:preprotein translocase subunit SecE
VARNRKRRSERRPGGPAGGAVQPGLATAGSARPDVRDESPDPIAHAAGDAELAEAQLALGRPELADSTSADADVGDDDGGGYDDEQPFDEEDAGAGGGGGFGGRGRGSYPEGTGPGGLAPARRPGGRLVEFLRGSWRELQRVQWPDRQQVMQATGVVVGFVIVAGVFLGVSDFVAQKVVNLILK